MTIVDWNQYRGRPVDFIDPQNKEAGWQYGAELIGVEPALFDGMENVQVRDKEGNYILIPVELAMNYLLLYSNETPENLVNE